MSTLFTDTQRASIRHYMGWSARFAQTDTALEQAMNSVEERDEEVARILGYVTALGVIDAELVAARPRLKAKQVGSIELPGVQEIGLLRSEGRRLVGALASALGVESRHDVYSDGTYAGRAGDQFQGSTGGYMKQG